LVRRQHQLRWQRPDLQIVDLRGNVPTRWRKLLGNEWDAIVLARAADRTLGHDLSGMFVFEGTSFHVEICRAQSFSGGWTRCDRAAVTKRREKQKRSRSA